MHHRLTADPIDSPVKGFNAPFFHLVHEDVEGRFIELDDIDSGGLQLFGFLVEEVREGQRHLGPAYGDGCFEHLPPPPGAGRAV